MQAVEANSIFTRCPSEKLERIHNTGAVNQTFSIICRQIEEPVSNIVGIIVSSL
jgi:hypothetical protein